MNNTARRHSVPVALSLAVSAALFIAPHLQAASDTWKTAPATNLWGTNTNWLGNTVPGTGDTATFKTASTQTTLDLGLGVTINTIFFDTASAAYTIGTGAVNSQVLTLNDSGAVTMNLPVANNQLFNSSLTLGTATAGSYTLSNNSPTNSLTFAGDIFGGTGGTAAAKTLTIGGTGATTVSGAIGNGGATSLGLVKSGAGTVTLSGANTYTGTTTVSGGTLTTTQTAGTPLGTGSLLLNSGTLRVAPATVSAVTDVSLTAASAAGQTLTVGGGATLALNKGGNQSLTLTVGNGTTGLTFNPGGALVLQPTALANLGVAQATGGERLIVSGTAPVNSNNVNLVGVPIVAQTSSSDTTGDFVRYDATNGFVSTAANYTSRAATFTTIPTNSILNMTASGTFNVNATVAGIRVGPGVQLGIGNSSNRTATLGNAAGISAPVILNGGSIAFGSGGGSVLAFGLSQGAIYTSAAGGTIGATTNAGRITGTAGLLIYGPGTLTLNSANLYTGTTFLAAGTVNVGRAEIAGTSGPLGTSAAANPGSIVFTGGTLQYSALNQNDYSGRFSIAGNQLISIDTNAQAVTFGTIIAGSGTSLTKLGSGTLTSTAANTYTGGTNVNAGALVLSGANNFGTGGVTVTGGTATLSNNNTYSGGNHVTGGTLTLSGANDFGAGNSQVSGGVLAISGANTGTGTTTLSGGNLIVTNTTGSATGSGGVVVNGGTLSGSGSIGGTVTVGGGTVAPGAAGVTLTLAGLTYSSGTLNFSLNGTGLTSSQLATTNTTFTATPTISFTGTNTVSNGQSFTLLTSATPITGSSFLSSIAPTTIGRLTLTPTLSGNSIIVNAAGSAANLIWAGGVAGLTTGTAPQGQGSIWNNTQNASASNFNNGGAYDFAYDADNVTFNDAGTANLAVNLTTNNAPATVTVDSTRNYVFSGAGSITGIGSLTKSGAGNLTLSTVNTYTGGTTINAGTITLGATNALPGTSGTLTVEGTGTVDLAGFNQTVSSLSDGGVATGIITSTSGTPTFTINNSTASTFGGAINGSLALVKTGTGTLTLSSANGYTGPTTLSAGTLTGTVAGAFGGGDVTVLPSGTAAVDSVVLNTSSSIASTANVTVNNNTLATSTINFNSATPTIGSLAGSGNVVLNNAGGTTLTTGNGSTTTFSGVISNGTGVTGGGLSLVGSGIFTLSGANTFSGTTTTGGTSVLILGNALALQNSTLDYNNQGGTFSFGALTATTLGGLSGAQNLDLSNSSTANVTLSIGGGNTTSSYTGLLSGGGALTKIGTGTVTIGSGAAGGATYTGLTTVNAGTLILGGVTNLSSTGNFAITGVANAASSAVVTDSAIFNTTGSILIANGGGASAVSGLSSLTVRNNAAVTASALSFGNNSRPGPNSFVTVQDTAALTINGTFNLNFTVSGTGNASNNILNLNGGTTSVNNFIATNGTNTNNHLSTINFNGGVLRPNIDNTTFLPALGGMTANVGVGGAIIDTNTHAITVDANLVHLASLAATLDGGLTKNGLGTLTVTGTSTYTGGTTVNAGTLQASGTATFGNVNGNLTVNTGGTVDLNGTSQSVGALIGTGGTIDSALAGASTLTVGNGDATGSFAGAIVNTVGTVAFTKVGTGTQTLTGINTYTGATTVTGGSLIVSSTGSLSASSPISIGVAGLLQYDSATVPGAITVDGILKGTGIIGNVTVSSTGIVRPGDSPGNLTVANFNLGTGTLAAEFNGAGGAANAGINYDIITASGTITLGGSLVADGIVTTNANNLYFLINNTSSNPLNGLLNAANQGDLITLGGQDFNISYTGDFGTNQFAGAGNDLVLVASAVPEPSSYALAIGGLGALIYFRRRRLAA